ncbi:MAG: hypothetical protein JKY42_03250 [Flavobacteriales bacterium]|nr:hypothetical protein [Flavobacteriales bacterium]
MIRILACILFLIPVWGYSQTTWEFQKEEGSFKVYTRTKKGTDIKESKVTGTVIGEINAMVAVFQDPDNFVNFMPDCNVSKKLKLEGDTLQVHYVLTEAPWPVSDRDGVYQFNYSHDPNSNSVLIIIKAVPDYIEKKEDVVRVHLCDGYWKLTELPGEYIQVEYVIYADPGGSIPGWLANTTAVDMPLETAVNAIERSKLAKYQEKEFEFIK